MLAFEKRLPPFTMSVTARVFSQSSVKSERRPKADPNKIRQVITTHPNAPVRDLAFLADCSHGAIERVLKEIEAENKEESGEDTDDIHQIKAQMEELQARLNRLSIKR